MRSMTGIGVGSAKAEGLTLRAELRSVNHRFLDVAAKLPAGMLALEPALREQIGAALARGRVTLNLEVERGGEQLEVTPNEPFLRAYTEVARKLAKRYGIPGELDLNHVANRPEAFIVTQRSVSERVLASLAKDAVDMALAKLNAMREKEGRALVRELKRRLKSIGTQLSVVEKHAGELPKLARKRLEDRLARLGAADSVDPSRLAAEVALMAEKATITEECERLHSHLNQFDETLGDDGPGAKRLGFLLQEMHREVNTIGSKSTQLHITNAVVHMKEEVENMREQIQNLE